MKKEEVSKSKMKYKILLIVCLFTFNLQAQKGNVYSKASAPKLIVGIVIDQMRYDFLFRYWSKFSSDGFKRLVNEGFLFENANFNYVPTYTAPGHACIFTGTSPSFNGIISNDWYDRKIRKGMYCVGDSTVKAVGTTSISGKMSPKNLLTTTVTDELRLASNFNSKVIGIALKDRGAILPAGHSANAAYWHDPYTNNWVSSTYYMNELPSWVKEFNDRKVADSLLNTVWNTLLPIDQYTESTADDNLYEGIFKGETKSVFPHDLPLIKKTDSELVRKTPAGLIFTTSFAVSALINEKLGKGTYTDFLTLSYSSTDYVGHMFGPNSIENEDMYLRLDKELAMLLKILDENIGKSQYVVFLTADHGVAHNTLFSKDKHIHAENFNETSMVESLKKFVTGRYGSDDILLNSSSQNIYLNRDVIQAKKLSLVDVQNDIAMFVGGFEGVVAVMTSSELEKGILRGGIHSYIQNGYYPLRSGDINIQLRSGWMDWFNSTGSTHGAAYSYDRHVPLIFFGMDIKNGRSSDPVDITDIAPTISSLLHIEFPSGNTGKPLVNYLK
jgi:predicted AlkP superfamily pyrophosphatase or phosphodiesterase